MAAELLADRKLVQSVLEDYRRSPLSEADKALMGFVRQVNRSAYEIRRGDVEQVRQAGWSDEALYDAITVCALFNFFNRWCDAAGVHGLPAEEYVKSGRRLAQGGYAIG
ncbi:MAG: carboxymuconolactone decarboxylase family protein [Terriglobia bacterium]